MSIGAINIDVLGVICGASLIRDIWSLRRTCRRLRAMINTMDVHGEVVVRHESKCKYVDVTYVVGPHVLQWRFGEFAVGNHWNGLYGRYERRFRPEASIGKFTVFSDHTNESTPVYLYVKGTEARHLIYHDRGRMRAFHRGYTSPWILLMNYYTYPIGHTRSTLYHTTWLQGTLDNPGIHPLSKQLMDVLD